MTVHWHCDLMAINPAQLKEELSEITCVYFSQEESVGPILHVSTERISDKKPGTIRLMVGFDPDGELTENLIQGSLPKSISSLFADFGVSKPEDLVRESRIKVIGIYLMDVLVGFKKIPD